VVITDAQRSQEDQLRTRQTRYILMMSVRVLSLIAAAVLVSAQVPLLWLWLVLCAIGMIVVPWFAVVLANDRLPKERHRLRRHRESEVTPPAVDQSQHHSRAQGRGGAGPEPIIEVDFNDRDPSTDR
jgi:hypothetical protein